MIAAKTPTRPPYAVPTGDILRGLVAQMNSGVVTVQSELNQQLRIHGVPEIDWRDTLNDIAEYLDRIEGDDKKQMARARRRARYQQKKLLRDQ